MKKTILFCLAAIVMLTLTACASKAEAPPEPTKAPVDNKTVEEHQKLAEKIYQAVKDNCTYHAEMMLQSRTIRTF